MSKRTTLTYELDTLAPPAKVIDAEFATAWIATDRAHLSRLLGSLLDVGVGEDPKDRNAVYFLWKDLD